MYVNAPEIIIIIILQIKVESSVGMYVCVYDTVSCL